VCVRVGDREDRAQHQKIEATLVRHEQSIEETKAAVYNTEAATSSMSRQIQRICLALNVDSDAEEKRPPPPRQVGILESSLYSTLSQEMYTET
jgi:septal ring factor EnvC (AmiA/AmiB activator)